MIGTQEIAILVTALIPLIAVYLLVRFFVQWRQRSTAPPVYTAAEIEKLFALKEKGAITQQEYDDRKSQLLHQ